MTDLTDRQKFYKTIADQRDHRRTLGVPNPKRITMALDMAELYGPEVDEACGVQEPTVDRWEAGTQIPSRDELQRLAFLTGFPVTFFYREDPEPFVGFICGPRGCQLVDNRPASPRARVIHLHGQGVLL